LIDDHQPYRRTGKNEVAADERGGSRVTRSAAQQEHRRRLRRRALFADHGDPEADRSGPRGAPVLLGEELDGLPLLASVDDPQELAHYSPTRSEDSCGSLLPAPS
jgi:hypothetical protein